MILVQREFAVPAESKAEFERQSREGLWPTFLHFGAQMVAFGSWAFGDDSVPLVTHTAYEDFDHWEATRGASSLNSINQTRSFYDDAEIMKETESLRGNFANRNALVLSSEARPFEVLTDAPHPSPFYRRAGQRLADEPPTFGRGSVVSERTLSLEPGTREEFVRLSSEVIWPWLTTQGGRGIAIGHDLMGDANEITTWFAFPTVSLWYACARPATANAPSEVVSAYQHRHTLVRQQRGRVLLVGTDWGRRE